MAYLDQFNELRHRTPHVGLQTVNNENSPYCQYTEESRNCYMTFASFRSNDCLYNLRVFYCTDCVDCSLCYKCELCYGCVDCQNSYNCNFCAYCEQAIDCDYCYFSIGIQNCFGCTGLKQKKFHIFNKPVPEAEYKTRVAELRKLPKAEILAKVRVLLNQTPHNAMYGKSNESSYGENIHNCKSTYWGFDSKYLHDCSYVYHCDESKDLLDCSHLGWSELCYQIMSGGNLNNCMFCYGCWGSHNLEYCELVYSSNDCFMCVGLNHKKYHILNEPYSREDYAQKVEEIKAEMRALGYYGKWFPSTYKEVLTYGL